MVASLHSVLPRSCQFVGANSSTDGFPKGWKSGYIDLPPRLVSYSLLDLECNIFFFLANQMKVILQKKTLV